MAEVAKILQLPGKLAYFQPEHISDAIESTHIEDHLPIGFSATNQRNPIRFFITGSEHYIDLEKSYFEIEGTIEGKDAATAGVAAKTSTEFSLTNNFLHNLFTSIHVNVNNSAVAFSHDNYPYVAYIHNLFNYPRDYQELIRDVYLWSKDTPGHMNDYGSGSNTNTGAAKRSNWIATGNKVRGIMHLHSPIFMINPYLLSFLNIDITLNRTENPGFYFMSKAGNTFTFRIDSIVLRMRKARLTANFVAGIEKMLHVQGENLIYPLRDSRVTTKTYSGYGADIIEDNLFHGVLPSRIVVGIVNNTAYKGTPDLNPFNFVHSNLTGIGLFLNGIPHPLPMEQMAFDTQATHRIYHHMLDSLQSSTPGLNSVAISKAEFDRGFTLFSFDMSADQYGGLNHQTLSNQPANVRLHLRFAQGDSNAVITLVIYYELSSRMVVNSSRQVTVYSK